MITLYSYKKIVMSYTKVHSVCAWSNSEIGYSSCSLTGNNYENGCMHVCEIWSQSVPLLLAINFPF